MYALANDDDNSLYYMYLSTLKDKRTRKVFDINGFSAEESIAMFRFEPEDIQRIVKIFNFQAKIKTSCGRTCESTEALCILLRRLAYPNRLCDLCGIFDRDKPELSEIANTMTSLIYDKYGSKLVNWEQTWLSKEHLQSYSNALALKGVPIKNCFGFIDGTLRPICRPTRYQHLVYNGHKRVHGLKFQSTVIPNGLIANMHGPEEGRIHDSTLLDRSGILNKMDEAALMDENGGHFCLYGDPAYGVRPQLIAPFRSARLTPEQAEFNKTMSLSRITVEWAFGKVISLFAFGDFKKNQKLFLQPVAKQYLVSVLLTNIHTCIYGSVVSNYFGIEPPSLETYLNLP